MKKILQTCFALCATIILGLYEIYDNILGAAAGLIKTIGAATTNTLTIGTTATNRDLTAGGPSVVNDSGAGIVKYMKAAKNFFNNLTGAGANITATAVPARMPT